MRSLVPSRVSTLFDPMSISKLALVGPGLLGGSIALAMRQRSPETRIAVWSRRAEAAEKVRALGIAEISSTELAPIIDGADFVVLCVPVGAMPGLAEKIA